VDRRVEAYNRSAVKQPKTTLLTLTANSATELHNVFGQTITFLH